MKSFNQIRKTTAQKLLIFEGFIFEQPFVFGLVWCIWFGLVCGRLASPLGAWLCALPRLAGEVRQLLPAGPLL